jgi:KaiB domain
VRYAFEVGLMHPFTHMIDIFVHSLHLQPVADSNGGKTDAMCLWHFAGHCGDQNVDRLQDPQRGLVHGIIVCPTLVRISPEPKQIAMGNLSDHSWLLPCRQRKRQNERISEVVIYP